jgi:hypothetical protein
MHQLLWVRPFSGMRTAVIVAAMLVEQLELFPPRSAIGCCRSLCTMGSLRIRRANLFVLWPPLPLHPERYSTDRAHACDGAVVVEFSSCSRQASDEGSAIYWRLLHLLFWEAFPLDRRPYRAANSY